MGKLRDVVELRKSAFEQAVKLEKELKGKLPKKLEKWWKKDGGYYTQYNLLVSGVIIDYKVFQSDMSRFGFPALCDFKKSIEDLRIAWQGMVKITIAVCGKGGYLVINFEAV